MLRPEHTAVQCTRQSSRRHPDVILFIDNAILIMILMLAPSLIREYSSVKAPVTSGSNIGFETRESAAALASFSSIIHVSLGVFCLVNVMCVGGQHNPLL
jgi:hypothetical protein